MVSRERTLERPIECPVPKKSATTRRSVARGSAARVAKKRAGAKATPKARRAAAAKSNAKPKRLTLRVASAVKKKVAARPAASTVAVKARARRGSGLTAKDLELFREMLLDKRRQLIGDVSGLERQALAKNRQDASGDLSNMPMHMADVGSDNYEQEFTLGLIEGERALLREIDAALGRIDSGTYGICEATGQPIGKARLKATPWTKYCYEHMLAQEQRRQRGR